VALLLALGCRDTTEPVSETSAPPATLTIWPAQTAFAVMLGMQMSLPVRLRAASGDSLPLPPSFTLVSRNPAVVSIDSGTIIQGRAMGSAWLVGSVTVSRRTVADSVAVAVVCTAELRVEITPGAQTLAVGESFTPTVKLTGCGGRLTLSDTVRWSAADSSVARVDAVSARTTGVRAGQTTVYARWDRYGLVAGVPVTVVSRP
jgi:hypothetical protein